jgi:DNA-binding response OmpR family regulator
MILIVEDNVDQARILSKMINRFVGEASYVTTYAGFETYLNDNWPEMMTLDFHVGDRTALDILRVANSHADLQGLTMMPVVILSGSSGSESNRERAQALGAIGWFRKADRVGPLLDFLRSSMTAAGHVVPDEAPVNL